MTSKEYHAHPALSSSGIRQFKRSPAHYQAWLKDRQTDSDALRFGRLVHCLTLDVSAFDSEFIIKPEDVDFRTKAGKEWRASVGERAVVDVEEMERARAISDAIHADRDAGPMLKDGEPEVSLFADCGGVEVKARPDFVPAEFGEFGDALIDIKTCADASEDEFSRSIAKYGYHIQAAHYLEVARLCGLARKRFIFIAVEKVAPFAIGVYELDEAAMLVALAEHRRLVKRFRECMKNDAWPAYCGGLKKISLPKWAMTANDNTTNQ